MGSKLSISKWLSCILALTALLWWALRQNDTHQTTKSQNFDVAKLAASVKSNSEIVTGEKKNTNSSAEIAISNANSSQSQNSPPALPQAIQILLSNKHRYPTQQRISTLTTNEEATLLVLYRSETELTNKLALTWALAAVGGENAAHTLIGTLRADYRQSRLQVRANRVLVDSMDALGYISSRSDDAYLFLREAASPTYWQQHRTWRQDTEAEEEFEDKAFAGLAIQALGISGRAGVREMLAEYKMRSPEVMQDYAGAVATAAFYYEVATTKGQKALLEDWLGGKTLDQYAAWTRTPTGSEWRRWSVSVKTGVPLK